MECRRPGSGAHNVINLKRGIDRLEVVLRFLEAASRRHFHLDHGLRTTWLVQLADRARLDFALRRRRSACHFPALAGGALGAS